MKMSTSTIARMALCLMVIATANANDIQEFAKGAPAIPPGFKNNDEVKTALITGKVKLIKPPAELPASITVEKDVQYGVGGDTPLLLDIYSPKEIKKPVPALIFIHGGGWKGGDKKSYSPYTIAYAEKGYVAATILYRKVPKALFPAPVEDAKCAVRWMRANAKKYNVDPNKIAVLGGSAGGHLSMMVAYSDDPKLEGNGGHADQSSRVQAVVNLYGVPDMTGALAANSPECTGFIGKPQAEAMDLYALASPITHITKDDPPTLSFHGTIDDLIPPAETENLHKKLEDAGVPNAYSIIEGWPHTMDAAVEVNAYCRYVIDRFLEKYLPLPK